MADPKNLSRFSLRKTQKTKKKPLEIPNLFPLSKDFILQLGRIHLIKQKSPLCQQIIEKKINHWALLGKEKIIFSSS